MTIGQSVARAGLLAIVAIACIGASDAPAGAEATTTGQQPGDAATTSPANDADRAAVEAAATDYVEALYRVEPSRIERSVHRDLVKRGFYPDNQGVWREYMMTYDELYDLAGSWNARGNVTAATSPWTVTVVEVTDRTATARVTADWGIDHMQLARYDGQWKIIHVLWQAGQFE
jgi:hypothetical protein